MNDAKAINWDAYNERIDILLEKAANFFDENRLSYIKELRNYPIAKVTNFLLAQLDTESIEARREIINILAHELFLDTYEYKAVLLDPFLPLHEVRREMIKAGVFQALMIARTEESLKTVTEIATSVNAMEDVKLSALYYMNIRDPNYFFDNYTILIKDQSSKIRSYVVRCLGSANKYEEQAIEYISDLLLTGNETEDVIISAIRALGSIKRRRALPLLYRMSESENVHIQNEAKFAISSLASALQE